MFIVGEWGVGGDNMVYRVRMRVRSNEKKEDTILLVIERHTHTHTKRGCGGARRR